VIWSDERVQGPHASCSGCGAGQDRDIAKNCPGAYASSAPMPWRWQGGALRALDKVSTGMTD